MAKGIEIKVGLDTREFDQKIGGVERKFKSAIDSNAQALNALKVATAALGAAGVAAFTQMARSAIDAAIAVDKTRQTLIALTGSAEAANRKLTELRELAKASPGVTVSFATQLFAQLKAIGGIADQTINGVIKSLGKLNAIFGDVGPDFARNLIQIFQQGFERSDIKEALGRVPIFEQLLESAFGTKDPAKLRKLKEAGTITMDTFLTGITEKINARFPEVREGIGAQFERLQGRIDAALAPLGDAIAKSLLPLLDDLVKKVEEAGPVMAVRFREAGDEIRAVSKAVLSLGSDIGTLIGWIDRLGQTFNVNRLFFRSLEASVLLMTGGAAAPLISRIESELRVGDAQTLRENRATFGGAPSRFGLFGATRPAAAGGGGGGGGGGSAADGAAASSAKRVAERAKRLAEARKSAAEGLDEFMKGNVEDLEAISKIINEANAVGEERRRQIAERPAQLAAHSAAIEARIRKDELETLRLEENTAKKAREALKKNEELLSNGQRLMKGFADATLTVGDAFDRFGASVAQAFGNVTNLFANLKQAVFGFFRDILGGTLQSLVRSTLGPIFGGLGGGRAAGGGALSIFGFGQGFGVPGLGGGTGSILSGGKFNFGALGESLLSSAPILGLGIGSALGGRSIGGNILGAAGGLLTSTFLATTLGAPGALGGLAPALFSNPLTAIAGAGLLVGSVLLGKAKQRKQDEEASGQMLTQALQGIEQLAAAVSSGQITTLAEARGVFENNILAQFISQIRTLKTKSVVESRLTNQVRDLRNVFESRIPPLVAEQEARRNTSAANALNFARQIPEFATGGITHGGLAVLHPREMVLNIQQQSAIARMAGPRVFEAAGVPGVQQSRVFDGGGIMPAGSPSGGPIEITILNTFGVGQSTCEVIATRGLNTAKGQAVIVKKIRDARMDKQL